MFCYPYPRVWSFSRQYTPPKVLGLMSIHDPDALCQFGGVTYCPWCGKEGQNEGIVVNHLWTTHYRLGLVCDRCYSCLSTTSNTLHHHGLTVADSERAFPPSQVHQLNNQEYTTASTITPHKEVKMEWSTQVPQGKRPVEKALLANLPNPSPTLPSS